MKLLKFFEFIFESLEKTKLPVIFFDDFEERISKINSPISNRFKEIMSKHVSNRDLYEYNVLSCGDLNDTIKYTDSYKLEDWIKKMYKSDPIKVLHKTKFDADSSIWTSNRTEVKIGRFIKKFFGSEFNDKTIESFVNQWKSVEEDARFELWNNLNVPNAYKTFNYNKEEIGGTLLNSCMNDQIRLVSFYRACPTVKVLVLLNDEGILARALVWVDSEGRTLMDRVYYSRDKDYYKFERYANKNGWYYKNSNYEFSKDGEQVTIFSKVKVPDVFKYKNDGFPYMDTYCYAQGVWAMNYVPLDGNDYFFLHEIDGGYEMGSGYEEEDPADLWNQ